MSTEKKESEWKEYILRGWPYLLPLFLIFCYTGYLIIRVIWVFRDVIWERLKEYFSALF